jgi:hypothetical protein
MRSEFSKQVKRNALVRAAGACEMCSAKLTVGKFQYDHRIADGLGGKPMLENCVVACHACHADKTRKHDIPLIAKVKRISDKHNGIRTARAKIQSPGFRRAAPQKTASRPLCRHGEG